MVYIYLHNLNNYFAILSFGKYTPELQEPIPMTND